MMTSRIRDTIARRGRNIPPDTELPRVYSFNEFQQATNPANPIIAPPGDARKHRLFFVVREGRFEQADLSAQILLLPWRAAVMGDSVGWGVV